MFIDILTLFPKMFKGPLTESILKRAQDPTLHSGKPPLKINLHDLRRWAINKHKMVDDRPFGGGPGMVLMVRPIYQALKDLTRIDPFSDHWQSPSRRESHYVILLTPQGSTFNQEKAEELRKFNHLIFIAGHYKGIDERVREHFVDQEISIGDYVLTGGELPAMVVIDAISRLLPDVVSKHQSVLEESFTLKDQKGNRLLGFPQYTRPENFKGLRVPKVLLSGHQQKIKEWRLKMALKITKKRRPDLLLSPKK